jgi:hypothetical protein
MSGDAIAIPLRRAAAERSLGRRFLGFFLQVKPRGWASARRWALVAIAFLVCWFAWGAFLTVHSSFLSRASYQFDYVKQPDGSWKVGEFGAGGEAVVRFSGGFQYRGGRGWERWTATPAAPPLLLSTTGAATLVPPSLLSQSEIDHARREGFQQLIDIENSLPASHMTHRGAIGCELLRDGATEKWRGAAAYWGRLAVLATGISLLGVSLGVGMLRTQRRLACERRIAMGKKGLCPGCRYPLGAGPVCSECGLDAAKDVIASLAILAPPRPECDTAPSSSSALPS